MPRLTVISDTASGTVLAACTTADALDGAAALAQLVGDGLLVAFEHQDLELGEGLSADAIPEADLESVVRDPFSFSVTRTGPAGNQVVSLERAPGVATLSISGADAKITVPTSDALPRQAWLLVKRGALPLVRHPGTIPNNGVETTFTNVVAAGDLVMALVVKHRPALQIVAAPQLVR